MIQFGIFAAVLVLIAMSLVLVPLFLAKSFETTDYDSVNTDLIKQQIKALNAEFENGLIDREQFEAAIKENEIMLYNDLDGMKKSLIVGSAGRWLFLPLLFAIPAISLFLYGTLGDLRVFDNQTVAEFQNTGNTSEQHTEASSSIEEMIEKLAKRLVDEPEDANGWLMLSRSYKVVNRFPEAVEAIKKARAILGDDPAILLKLADALAMANQGSLVGEPTRLIREALQEEPENTMGLWLNGMAYAELREYQKAVEIWQQLLKQFKPGDENYLQVEKLINEANARQGKPAVSVASGQPAPQSLGQAVAVKVKVGLVNEWLTKVDPNDVLLVYAQASQGPKAPLAIVRKKVADLPFEIELNESHAMMPNMTLASFDDIKITARISKTGGASPQSGDLYGTVAVSRNERGRIQAILINSVISE